MRSMRKISLTAISRLFIQIRYNTPNLQCLLCLTIKPTKFTLLHQLRFANFHVDILAIIFVPPKKKSSQECWSRHFNIHIAQIYTIIHSTSQSYRYKLHKMIVFKFNMLTIDPKSQQIERRPIIRDRSR